MAFEESASHALDVLNGLLSAAEDGRAQMLEMRERILAATTRLDSDWALLRERARVFLEQAAGQEHQLVALKTEAARASEGLRVRVEQLQEQGEEETQLTQVEIDSLAHETEEEGEKVQAQLRAAEEAELGLEAGLREVQADLAAAMAEADELLRDTLVSEVRQIEQEVERQAIELSAYFSGQCVPLLEQKAYDLYTFLVQAEADVRDALEASLESNESAADAVLRECADDYDDTLDDLAKLGGALEDLLHDLREFIDDGRDRLDDRKRRWDEGLRRGREGLRDALEALREVEHYLSRFSFGR